MRKLFLLFVSVSFLSCGSYTPIPVSVEPSTSTFELPGEKNDLYVKANNWMVENFNDAKSVIQFADKESGTVTGKYRVGEVYTNLNQLPQDVFAIVRLQLKDGAAKITVTPDEYQYFTSMGVSESQKLSEDILKQRIEALTVSFEDYMRNSDSTDF